MQACAACRGIERATPSLAPRPCCPQDVCVFYSNGTKDGVPDLELQSNTAAMGVPATSQCRRMVAWRDGIMAASDRVVPEETAIAFSYNRIAHAVMMATPGDLRDFAVGFSITEGIVADAAGIEELEIVPAPHGIELRMWIPAPAMQAVEARRRQMAGPTGCGMCGLESLDQAMRGAPPVPPGTTFSPAQVQAAVASLFPAQALNRVTRAVHAAGFVQPGHPPLVREDVGRHNALDKLGGAMALAGRDPAAGILVMTSRVSVELVQKAARIGIPVLVAVSAPTALALRVAEGAGITVAGIARDDGFEVFTHSGRIVASASRQAL